MKPEKERCMEDLNPGYAPGFGLGAGGLYVCTSDAVTVGRRQN